MKRYFYRETYTAGHARRNLERTLTSLQLGPLELRFDVTTMGKWKKAAAIELWMGEFVCFDLDVSTVEARMRVRAGVSIYD